jgi:hypothetical protein
MKRLIALFSLAVMAMPALAKEDWRGKVVDESGEPVAYANVAVLSKADSTVVCGTVTGEDGSFNIITGETDGIMMVAMMGYRTVYLPPMDGATITLKADSAMLEGAAKNEFKRWNSLNNTEFWGFKEPYSSYDEAVDSLQSWIRQRIAWIDEHI